MSSAQQFPPSQQFPPAQPYQGFVNSPPPTPLGISGLGIASLIIGIISLVLCLIPIINNAVFIIGLVGLVLGIIGVVITKRTPPKKRGFGLALAGVILCVVALIGAIVSQAFYSKVISEVGKVLETATMVPVENGNSPEDSQDNQSESHSDSAGDLTIDLVSLVPVGNDYEGNPTAMLTYTVTNNGTENYDVYMLDVKAFQNGVSLDTAIYLEDPEGYDASSEAQTIQPGGTATVTKGYILKDSASPVEVQAEDFLDWDSSSEPVTKEFPIQ